MSPFFPLTDICELGRRADDGVALPPVDWAGLTLTADDLRGIHHCLDGLLLLVHLAGYQPDVVVLGAEAAYTDFALELHLWPRHGVPEYQAGPHADSALVAHVGVDWPAGATFAAAIPLQPRSGLEEVAVGLDDDPVVGPRVSGGQLAHLVIPAGLGGAPVTDGPSLALSLLAELQVVRDGLCELLAERWWTDGHVDTGMLSLLDPDQWSFPQVDEPEVLATARQEAFRQVGRPIFTDLTSRDGVRDFLLEESAAPALEGDGSPSVFSRLLVVFGGDGAAVRGLAAAWRNEARAQWEVAYPAAEGRPPFRTPDHRRFGYCELVFDAANHLMLDSLAHGLGGTTVPYGSYDLRIGDSDDPPVYGGIPRVSGLDVLPAEGQPGFVAELRTDLTAVGYGPLLDGDPTPGTFGVWLEAAVREFQIYASMEQVAERSIISGPLPGNESRGSSLVPVVNDRRFQGPASGVLDTETRSLLQHWLASSWHCPVVVETRSLDAADLTAMRDAGPATDRAAIVLGKPVLSDNVWLGRQDTTAGRTFIVWDHTDTEVREPYRAGQPMVLCRYHAVPGWGGASGYNVGQQEAYLYPAAEITPGHVKATTPDPTVDRAFWSTFRTIRPVSEMESMGYFDGINGWDWAITSGGPLHWTLGVRKKNNGKTPADHSAESVVYDGELGGFLAYFAATEPDEYRWAFGQFGIQPLHSWAGAGPPHFVPAHRKYTGWVAQQGIDGNWVDGRRAQAGPPNNPVASETDSELAETFKTWHWTHRVLRASRSSPVMMRRMWEFTRARIRELLSVPWRVGGGAPEAYTIGDVFTSERAIALVERQHVFNPQVLFGHNDRAAVWGGKTLEDIDLTELQPVFNVAAAVAGNVDPADWGDAEQAAIITNLTAAATPFDKQADLVQIAAWPSWDTGANPRHYDRSWLELANPSPRVEQLPNLHLQPGEMAHVVVEATSVTAFEIQPLTAIDIVDGPEDLMVTSDLDGAGFELLVGTDTPAGRWVVEVTVSDGRYESRVSFDLDVSETGGPPSATDHEPEMLGTLELDPRHRSFQLDGNDADDPFPPPVE